MRGEADEGLLPARLPEQRSRRSSRSRKSWEESVGRQREHRHADKRNSKEIALMDSDPFGGGLDRLSSDEDNPAGVPPRNLPSQGKGMGEVEVRVAVSVSGQSGGSSKDPSILGSQSNRKEREDEEWDSQHRHQSAPKQTSCHETYCCVSSPPLSTLPPRVSLPGPFGEETRLSAEAFGNLVSSYNVLRAFSWQLKLSPFSLETLGAAFSSGQPSPLVDELHVCVIRALALWETKDQRQRRWLDLELLDHVTWPEFVWEWLSLSGAKELLPWQYTRLPLAELTYVYEGGSKSSVHRKANGELETANAVDGGVEGVGRDVTGDAAELCHSRQEHLSRPDTTTPCVQQKEQPFVNQSDREPYNSAMVKDLMKQRGPKLRLFKQDYYSLSVEQNTAILARLCNDLLDTNPIRSEIDRREAQSMWHAGLGGIGGAFPMRGPEEKVGGAEAGDDGNTDICVLCGAGGSLLCCDGCPAAYHLKCIGETQKSIPDGDWLCPECYLGGRHEAAGLRVPLAGVLGDGCPVWLAYGSVFHGSMAGAADLQFRRNEPKRGCCVDMEDDYPLALQWCAGLEAREKLEGIQKVKKSTDPCPHPSSWTAVAQYGWMAFQEESDAKEMMRCGVDGGRSNRRLRIARDRNQESVELETANPLSPDQYINKYRYAWGPAVAVVKTALDQELRKRRAAVSGSTVPTAMPISRFTWPLGPGRRAGKGGRCGKCLTCLRPTMKKACLSPIVKENDLDLCGSQKEPKRSTKLTVLQNYLLRAERDLMGLLEGPWRQAPSKGNDGRQEWLSAVKGAVNVVQLGACVLVLEDAIRKNVPVMRPQWDPTRPRLVVANSYIASRPRRVSGSGLQPGGKPIGQYVEGQQAKPIFQDMGSDHIQSFDYINPDVLQNVWMLDDSLAADGDRACVALQGSMPPPPLEVLMQKAPVEVFPSDTAEVEVQDLVTVLSAPEEVQDQEVERSESLVPVGQLTAAVSEAVTTVAPPAEGAPDAFVGETSLHTHVASQTRAGNVEGFLNLARIQTSPVLLESGVHPANDKETASRPLCGEAGPWSPQPATPAPSAPWSGQQDMVSMRPPPPSPHDSLPGPTRANCHQGSTEARRSSPVHHSDSCMAHSGSIDLIDFLVEPPAEVENGGHKRQGERPEMLTCDGSGDPPEVLEDSGSSDMDKHTVLDTAKGDEINQGSLNRGVSARPALGGKAEADIPPQCIQRLSNRNRLPAVESKVIDVTGGLETLGAHHAPAGADGHSKHDPGGQALTTGGALEGRAEVAVTRRPRGRPAKKGLVNAKVATSIEDHMNQRKDGGPAIGLKQEGQGGPEPNSTILRSRPFPAAPQKLLRNAAAVKKELEEVSEDEGESGSYDCADEEDNFWLSDKEAMDEDTWVPVNNWMWWRNLGGRCEGKQRLLKKPTRHLARAGAVKSQHRGLKYQGNFHHAIIPRLKWAAAVEAATSTAQLGLLLRQFDQNVNWEGLKKPSGAECVDGELYESTDIKEARRRENCMGWEYLLVKERRPGEKVASHTSHYPSVDVWKDEVELPLWLIKTYEEQCRREEARKAAQNAAQVAAKAREVAREAAAVAAKEQQTSTGPAAKAAAMEALKAAKEAEAAAAAYAAENTCAACGLNFGDDAELDISWIACDQCNRWYHSACEGMSSSQVSALPDDLKYTCTSCLKAKVQQRQKAVDKYKQRRRSRGVPAPISVATDPTHVIPGLSEPALSGPVLVWSPLSQQTLLVDPSLLTLEPLRFEPRVQVDGVAQLAKGVRKAGFGVEGGAAQQMHEAGVSKRGRGRKTTWTMHEEKVFCVCQRPWNELDGDMVMCETCTDWFHPECVGTSIEEVQKMKKWYCPMCERRQRRQGKRRSRWVELDKEVTLVGTGEPGIALGDEGQTPPQITCRGSADGCRSKRKRSELAYVDVEEQRQGVEKLQVSKNRTEQVAGDGRRREGSSALVDGDVAQTVGAQVAGLSQPVSGTTTKIRQGTVPWEEKVTAVLNEVLDADFSEPFAQPVPPSNQLYHRLITTAMDLGSIQKQVSQGGYSDIGAVQADIQLVWRNCRLFNDRTSNINKQCTQTKNHLERLWAKADLPKFGTDVERKFWKKILLGNLQDDLELIRKEVATATGQPFHVQRRGAVIQGRKRQTCWVEEPHDVGSLPTVSLCKAAKSEQRQTRQDEGDPSGPLRLSTRSKRTLGPVPRDVPEEGGSTYSSRYGRVSKRTSPWSPKQSMMETSLVPKVGEAELEMNCPLKDITPADNMTSSEVGQRGIQEAAVEGQCHSGEEPAGPTEDPAVGAVLEVPPFPEQSAIGDFPPPMSRPPGLPAHIVPTLEEVSLKGQLPDGGNAERVPPPMAPGNKSSKSRSGNPQIQDDGMGKPYVTEELPTVGGPGQVAIEEEDFLSSGKLPQMGDSDPGDGEDLVSTRIEVFWDGDHIFYPCTVVSYNQETGRHMVKYDDGVLEEEDLSVQRWKLYKPRRASRKSGMMQKWNTSEPVALAWEDLQQGTGLLASGDGTPGLSFPGEPGDSTVPDTSFARHHKYQDEEDHRVLEAAPVTGPLSVKKKSRKRKIIQLAPGQATILEQGAGDAADEEEGVPSTKSKYIGVNRKQLDSKGDFRSPQDDDDDDAREPKRETALAIVPQRRLRRSESLEGQALGGQQVKVWDVRAKDRCVGRIRADVAQHSNSLEGTEAAVEVQLSEVKGGRAGRGGRAKLAPGRPGRLRSMGQLGHRHASPRTQIIPHGGDTGNQKSLGSKTKKVASSAGAQATSSAPKSGSKWEHANSDLPPVGSRVRVWWIKDQCFYSATVVKVEGAKVTLDYDDSVKETLQLRRHHWEYEDRSSCFLPTSADLESIQRKDPVLPKTLPL